MLKKFPAFVRVAWVSSAEASFSAARDGRLGHPAAARPVVKELSRDGLLYAATVPHRDAQNRTGRAGGRETRDRVEDAGTGPLLMSAGKPAL